MAWTAATFKAARPEFAEVADAIVTQYLADAVADNDVRVFGTTGIDAMVSLDAADRIACSPYGQQARLDPKSDGRTIYRVQWERLARDKAGGPIAIGQTP